MVYSIRPVITNNISLQCCVISVQIVFLMVMWWRYLQGNRLAIHRLWVPVSAGYHCIVALVKLLTLVASVIKQYHLAPANGVISLAGKVTVGLVESNNSLPLDL